jgi:hypothetical protein
MPMTETFKDKVCRHFEVPPERYGDTVLALTLYPHARWLRLGAAHRLVEADRTFIEAVGRLTRWRGLSGEVWEFRRDPRNRLFWRQSLRLRVSVLRMRALFSEVWGESIPAGGSPVEHPPHPASPFLTHGGYRS